MRFNKGTGNLARRVAKRKKKERAKGRQTLHSKRAEGHVRQQKRMREDKPIKEPLPSRGETGRGGNGLKGSQSAALSRGGGSYQKKLDKSFKGFRRRKGDSQGGQRGQQRTTCLLESDSGFGKVRRKKMGR